MRRAWVLVVVLCVQTLVRAEGPANPTFESDSPGRPPEGWFIPGPAASAGWTAAVREDIGGRSGKCVVLGRSSAAAGGAGGMGNLMQQIDAAPYRGKRIIMTAWMRVKPDNAQAGGRAQMWLRADREDGRPGFFDNSSERPATSADWQQYRLIADIDADAAGIALGFMAFGATVWIDDVMFDVIGDAVTASEPPRELSDQGVINLVAFARLVGYVRYYHPSDEAAACDWPEFIRSRVPAVESAANTTALAEQLASMFEPLAPAMRIRTAPFAEAFEPRSMLADGQQPAQVTAWFRYGFDAAGDHGIYEAERKRWNAGDAPPELVADIGAEKTAEIAPGLWVRVPIAVYRDSEGTLPRAVLSIMPTPDEAYVRPSGDDRTTRLTGIIIAWNVFQHHYPYFDVVPVDWDQALVASLREAAMDTDARDYHNTLEKLVAKLEDGHGYVGHTNEGRWARLPLAWCFVGEKLIVTEVAAGVGEIREGDEVVAINGTGVPDLAWAAAARMSASTPQFRRFRTASDLARGEPGESCALRLVRPDGTMYEQSVVYAQQGPTEPRPEKIAEIRPGIWYVDIDRVNDADIAAAMDKLAAAKGLVFDLRGYPGNLSTIVLAHLADQPIRSARWCAPFLPRPDREGISYANGGWPVMPMQPRWTGNAAFVIDGRAISYAETYMGIVEHFKLAAIVGEATAGTNGNVTGFSLPGGYSIGFTGMRVLKHDGSTHHGIGILPTIPVQRTVTGIAAGRDELLEAAVSHVEKHAAK